ncbi:hypothetical protein [Comamonas thiooxydans]|uniref:hypothetical protein n=1 Tax=Comamonas thiooxydans TaxID=363952 RepID=UPI0012E860E6|nr:hypothetical protein [Comamonas thiooxydans]
MATQNNNALAVGVHGPVRPWVYKRLVRQDNDFVGLIAYSLYKKRKTEIAESHRNNGEGEDVIVLKLREYHDQVVVGDNEIERFRSDATALLNGLLNNVTSDLQKGHQQAVQEIGVKHEKALKDARGSHEKALREAKKQAIDDVSKSAKQAKQGLGVRDRCVSWLLDGVQTTLAGVLVTVVSFGAVSLLTSDNWKAEMAAKTVQLLTGTSPKPSAEK